MPVYRRIQIGHYLIPDEALQLQSDIVRLDMLIDLVEKLDPLSLGETKDQGFSVKRRMSQVVATWRWYAWDKLRSTYLAGRPIRRRQRQQTSEDISEIFLQRLNELRQKSSNQT